MVAFEAMRRNVSGLVRTPDSVAQALLPVLKRHLKETGTDRSVCATLLLQSDRPATVRALAA